MQLKVETGYGWRKDTGEEPYQGGISNVLLGAKWMFFSSEEREQSGIFSKVTRCVYPQVGLAPSSSSVRRELAEPGVRYTLPLLATKTINVGSRPVSITFNLGGEHGGPQPDDIYWAMGGGTRIDDGTSAMVSFSDETALKPGPNKLVQVQLGALAA